MQILTSHLALIFNNTNPLKCLVQSVQLSLVLFLNDPSQTQTHVSRVCGRNLQQFQRKSRGIEILLKLVLAGTRQAVKWRLASAGSQAGTRREASGAGGTGIKKSIPCRSLVYDMHSTS